jgi:hypothetical protein
MPAWLRNVRVLFWLTVIIGGALAAILVPWVDGLLPDVSWWPFAWPVAFAFTSLVLIVLAAPFLRRRID